MSLHILLADDSMPAQNMGKKILTDAGYDVTTVSNGLEALRKIAETVPDIAILDIFMPGYSGLEVCQKLRANAATAALPVILTVGKLEPFRPEDGEQVRSNAVIVKPFSATELISAVRSLVGGPPVVGSLQPAPNPLAAAAAEPAASPFAKAYVAPPTPAVEPSDEPLFSYGTPNKTETEPLQSAATESAYGAEFLLTKANQPAHEGLLFNPDAARTPFSASVTDLLPSVQPAEAAPEESPLTEFNLASTPSIYSGAEPLANPRGDAPDPMRDLLEPFSPPVAPDVPVTSDPVYSGAPQPMGLEVPELDPLLETTQDVTPPGILGASVLQVGEPPEHLVLDDFQEAVAPPAAVPEEVLSPEESARRKAFEDLFNSAELPPLEESPTVAAPVHTDILPSISTPHVGQVANVLPDPELEPQDHGALLPTLSSAPDPLIMEEEEARSAIGNIPDRDALLDSPQGPLSHAKDARAEEILAPSGEQFSPAAPLNAEVAPASQVPASAAPLETGHIPAPATQAVPPVAEPLPATAEPARHEELHSVLPTLAALATGTGLAAGFPMLEHLLQPETKPTPAVPEPLQHEPEAHIAPAAPQPVAPPPVAVPEPALTKPSEPHSVLPTLAALATGTGLGAGFPTLEHLLQPETKPVAAVPELLHHAPEIPATPATPPPAPLPVAPLPVAAPESAHAKAAEPHSPLSALAGLASGAGIAAALPTLAHLVESELKHAPAAPEPAPHQALPTAVAPPVARVEPVASAPSAPAAEPEPVKLIEPPPAMVVAQAAKPAPVHEEPLAPAPEIKAAPVPAPEAVAAPVVDSVTRSPEAERVHIAVERVFERFKPLLIAAIVRELARLD